jgi:CotS family spore coat protein
MPEWISQLLKEFTKPPYFLDHLMQERQRASSPSPGDGRSPESQSFVATPSPPKKSTQTTRSWNNATSTGPPTPRSSSDARSGDFPKPRPSSSASKSRAPSKMPEGDKDDANAEFVPTTLGEAEASTRTRPWSSVFRQAGYTVGLAKAYGWQVQNAVPHSNILRVETQSGSYALKQTHVSVERVQFLHDAVRHLRKQGFAYAPRYALTAKKQPAVVRQNRTYYATKWVEGNHVNFASLPQLGRLARTLAEFHELSRGFEATRYNPPAEYGVASMIRRRSEDLRNILMRAETKAHPDEFDELLIRLAPTLREDAEKSLRIAEDEMCRKFLLQDEDNPGLCHLDVIPGNFVYTQDKEVFLLDLDLATFAPRVLDMAHLLRRSLQMLHWQSDIAYTCFVSYDTVRPITPEEYLWVQCLLTFPYRAWRLAHTRYHVLKDRTQTEELRDYAAQEVRRQAFLEAYAEQITREVE